MSKSNCKHCQNKCKIFTLNCEKYNPSNIDKDKNELRELQVKRMQNERREYLENKINHFEWGMK